MENSVDPGQMGSKMINVGPAGLGFVFIVWIENSVGPDPLASDIEF